MNAPKTSTNAERVVSTLRESASVLAGPANPEAMLSTIAESQREMFEFMRMRLEKDGDVARKVFGCRNWTDAFEAQSQWAQEMVQDYAAEMTRMVSIYAGHGADISRAKSRRA
jgi:hypothetical protein